MVEKGAIFEAELMFSKKSSIELHINIETFIKICVDYLFINNINMHEEYLRNIFFAVMTS